MPSNSSEGGLWLPRSFNVGEPEFMVWLPPAFAILIALFGSTAHAGPPAVPRAYQAGFYLPGCCVGAAEVL